MDVLSVNSNATTSSPMEQPTGTSKPRTIVIGLDGSKQSEYALVWTTENIVRKGDELYLLHVEVPPPIPEYGFATRSFSTEAIWIDSLHRAEQASHRVVQRYKEIASELSTKLDSSINIHVASERGDARDVISQFATTHHADLIVCGSRDLTAVEHMLMGSTGMYLVNHARIPVVIVPKQDEVAGN
eukprot:CAMPEP_0184697706 /NCGR_PEP_ID=MMETSP0313-20130426/4589_1 /TAXON_ID=2792 /ORGANISM="Porphyridium aerugineum, Strain SAG 1380-2" /LENGTH=185 /DNA_ID=CAMNT_0027156539 /DNA_START=127 /DNA_END=684 /DNA_ORIENTATION=-